MAFGEQELVIIGNRNESAIEHPVEGTAKCDAVPKRVRSGAGHWANVCRLDFAATATVDDLEAGESACIAIGRLDRSRKRSFAERACYDALDKRPLKFRCELCESRRRYLRGVLRWPVSRDDCDESGAQMASYSWSGSWRTARPKAPLFVSPSPRRRADS